MLSWLLLMLLLYSKEICTAAARNCWGVGGFLPGKLYKIQRKIL